MRKLKPLSELANEHLRKGDLLVLALSERKGKITGFVEDVSYCGDEKLSVNNMDLYSSSNYPEIGIIIGQISENQWFDRGESNRGYSIKGYEIQRRAGSRVR